MPGQRECVPLIDEILPKSISRILRYFFPKRREEDRVHRGIIYKIKENPGAGLDDSIHRFYKNAYSKKRAVIFFLEQLHAISIPRMVI